MSISPLLSPVFTVYSQPFIHFYNNRAITPKPFHTDGISDGSKEVVMWGSKFWKRRVHPSFMIASWVFKRVWSALSWWTTAIFLWCPTLLKRFSNVLRIRITDMNWWFDHVAQCRPNNPFCIPKQIDHDFSCWKGSLKYLLPGRTWTMQFQWPPFCLRFKVKDPCFIPKRTVRKSFHHQPRNGTVNPNIPLSAQGVWQASWNPTNIVLNTLKFTPPLDTEGSVASFLFVIRRYFQEFMGRLKQWASVG